MYSWKYLGETQLKNEGVKILSGIKFISLNKIVLGIDAIFCRWKSYQ